MREGSAHSEGSASGRHAGKVATLRRAVFDSDAVTDRALRDAAGAGHDVPAPVSAYVAKVREASFRVTDADVGDLREAGYGEEEIFELTIAAALGAALRRRDAGLAALEGGS